jgi:MFS family permease
VFLPLFVLVESRVKQPMLDLSIFQSRLFSFASIAAFLNGLARFALTFVFVFYFQGVQGDSPLLAGLKLAPLALGMLIASPIAGIYADRQGSRALASVGMAVTALGLGLMTTLGRETSYVYPAIFQMIVGIGSGMFNSPNTAAMMGVVAPHRRGIASGARVLVQNTGAVLSIALVLAIATASVPKSTLFNVFSGLGARISDTQISPFLANLHLALWILCGVSVIGIFVCFSRPKQVSEDPSGATSGDLEEAQTALVAAS